MSLESWLEDAEARFDGYYRGKTAVSIDDVLEDFLKALAVIRAVSEFADRLAALETYNSPQEAIEATFGNHDDGYYAGHAMGRVSVAADIREAMEAALAANEKPSQFLIDAQEVNARADAFVEAHRPTQADMQREYRAL